MTVKLNGQKTSKTYLTTGYIRNESIEANTDSYDYESSISTVIMGYIGSIFLKFDLCHDKWKKGCIKDAT